MTESFVPKITTSKHKGQCTAIVISWPGVKLKLLSFVIHWYIIYKFSSAFNVYAPNEWHWKQYQKKTTYFYGSRRRNRSLWKLPNGMVHLCVDFQLKKQKQLYPWEHDKMPHTHPIKSNVIEASTLLLLYVRFGCSMSIANLNSCNCTHLMPKWLNAMWIFVLTLTVWFVAQTIPIRFLPLLLLLRYCLYRWIFLFSQFYSPPDNLFEWFIQFTYFSLIDIICYINIMYKRNISKEKN